jgi:hypothetical protein
MANQIKQSVMVGRGQMELGFMGVSLPGGVEVFMPRKSYRSFKAVSKWVSERSVLGGVVQEWEGGNWSWKSN